MMRLHLFAFAFCLMLTLFWTGCSRVAKPPPSVPPVPAIEPPVEKVEAEKPAVSKPERFNRAMWVWKSLEVIQSSEKAERLFDFCEQPPSGAPPIDRLYFYVTVGLLRSSSGQEQLAEFIKAAHARGLEIHLLGGSPEMSYQKIAGFNLIKNLNVYNQSVEPASRFDGLHLDIEPHTLGIVWEQDDRLRNRFMETIQLYYEKFNEVRNGMTMGLDIAFGYAEDLRLLTTLIDNSDYVTIMDYRDTAEAIINFADPVLKVSLERGKTAEIGIETQKPNDRYGVTPLITFWDEGSRRMEVVLKEVEEHFKNQDAFVGIAVHDYKAYKTLPEGTSAFVDAREYPTLPTVIVPYTENPIPIKGNLSNWKNSPSIVMKDLRNVVAGKSTWTSKEDLSGKVWLAWDANNFYMAVDVTDDQIVQPFKASDMLNGDHIELWLDLDYEKNKRGVTTSKGLFQLGISPGNFADNPPALHDWIPGGLVKTKGSEVDISAVKTAKGYFVETRIPWTFFGDFKPAAQKPFRINVDISDTDNSVRPSQETLMSSSPHRKFGNPNTFRYAEFRK